MFFAHSAIGLIDSPVAVGKRYFDARFRSPHEHRIAGGGVFSLAAKPGHLLLKVRTDAGISISLCNCQIAEYISLIIISVFIKHHYFNEKVSIDGY